MSHSTAASREMRLIAVVGCTIATVLALIAALRPPTSHSAERAATSPLYLPQISKPSPPRIAFAHSCQNNSCYSTIYPDGSGRTQIFGPEPPAPFDPQWSPDGRTLAVKEWFSVGGFQYQSLWVIDAATHVRRRLTDDTLNISYPAWSPDGSKLTFAGQAATPSAPPANIYAIAADGSRLTRLTDDASNQRRPTWSPDGQTIAFAATTASTITHETTLKLINADGTGPRDLTSSMFDSMVYNLTWSPDGRWIAFHISPSAHSDLAWTIHLIHPDGTGHKPLAEGLWSPMSWSPDGHWLACWRELPDGSPGLVAINPEDETMRVLASEVAAPPSQGSEIRAWSPDGSAIVFARPDPAGPGTIISRVEADGTGLRDLATGYMPVWLP